MASTPEQMAAFRKGLSDLLDAMAGLDVVWIEDAIDHDVYEKVFKMSFDEARFELSALIPDDTDSDDELPACRYCGGDTHDGDYGVCQSCERKYGWMQE